MTNISQFLTYTLREVTGPAARLAGETLIVLSLVLLIGAGYVLNQSQGEMYISGCSATWQGIPPIAGNGYHQDTQAPFLSVHKM